MTVIKQALSTQFFIDKLYNFLQSPFYLVSVSNQWLPNHISNMSNSELIIAVDYWEKEYRPKTKLSLFEFIDSEWDSERFEPALGKIKKIYGDIYKSKNLNYDKKYKNCRQKFDYNKNEGIYNKLK